MDKDRIDYLLGRPMVYSTIVKRFKKIKKLMMSEPEGYSNGRKYESVSKKQA